MDVERIIYDIEQLEEMFEASDIRPLSASDISAANRRHDEMLVHSPWFRIWQQFGVCCRGEAEGGRRIQSQSRLPAFSSASAISSSVRHSIFSPDSASTALERFSHSPPLRASMSAMTASKSGDLLF
jgi:hypothetical protein